MQISLDSGTRNTYHIRAYGDQFIQVNDRYIRESFIISPTQLIVPWKVDATTPTSLSIQDLTPLLTLNPTLVLLGTGRRLSFPPQSTLHWLTEQHIRFEVMDTLAACRSYMVLASENRSVAAALML